MIAGLELTAVLHAIGTGFPERARSVILQADVEDDLRGALHAAVLDNESAAAQARALGDVFRDAAVDQFLVNECYRAAFYFGRDWATLAENPLYAYFLANRAYRAFDKWVHYFPIYHRHLEPFRRRPVRVLEIGVYRAGGLDLLQWYLGPQARIVGIDIDEAAQRAAADHHTVILGDQEDPEFLRRVVADHGPFDVIIDDGGHTMRQQIVSVETLFGDLADGGVYVVEDTHTSYWQEFGGGLHDPESFLSWSRARFDDLHWRYDSRIDRHSVWARELGAIHVYDSVVVFDKECRHAPFNEMVGSGSFLFADRFSEGIGTELLATRDAAVRERDELRRRMSAEGKEAAVAEISAGAADAEQVRQLRSELRRSHAELDQRVQELLKTTVELDRTRNELLESWQHIREIRRTVSWRFTAPLRRIRSSR